ncbi:hypothetical protein RB195_005687 [Necator americanus]|uniref:Uncharacterized protein n=1 Tax=Necator americanus TaxID=51031 RepID=A0ABR1BP41_NECAM
MRTILSLPRQDGSNISDLMPIASDLLAEKTTPTTELSKAYMTMMAFCFVHALAFIMIALLSCRLRSSYK